MKQINRAHVSGIGGSHLAGLEGFGAQEGFGTVDYKFENLTEEEVTTLTEKFWFMRTMPEIEKDLRENWIGKKGYLLMNLIWGSQVQSYDISEEEK